MLGDDRMKNFESILKKAGMDPKKFPFNVFNEDGVAWDTSVNGKRAVKYEKAWIILARVKGKLYLAAEGGTKPPTPVMLIKLDDGDLFNE